MQAIIMAGGKGTRLRPYTYILPKPLLPIGARSIIEINILQLVKYGFSDIIISLGYLGNLIENVIGDGKKYGINISYIYESESLGTAGSLSMIKSRLNNDFIVMNGDLLHNLDLKHLLNIHKNNDCEVTVSTKQKEYKIRLGILDFKNDKIVKYIEKPTTTHLVSIGIYAMNNSIVSHFVPKNKYLDFPTLINNLISNNINITHYEHDGLWIDLGVYEDYSMLNDDLDDIKKSYPMVPII